MVNKLAFNHFMIGCTNVYFLLCLFVCSVLEGWEFHLLHVWTPCIFACKSTMIRDFSQDSEEVHEDYLFIRGEYNDSSNLFFFQFSSVSVAITDT